MALNVRSTIASSSASLAGIGLMLAAIFLFSLNDALGKWLVATYSVGELLLIRGVTALILLLPFVWRVGLLPFWNVSRPGLQFLRLLLATCEVAMFFWAASYLPLADVVTFYLAGPIYVTALSGWLLGEEVGWRRWTAVIVGFAGVLIALRPSTASFTLPALIALTGSLSFAFLMIVTRLLRETPDTVLVTSQIVMTVIFGAIAAPFGWITPSLPDLAGLCLFGVISMGALACVNRSLKLAPASVVVPYQYTLIVWAILFGYLVFDDRPGPATLLGAAVIIGAGLYIFYREQARGQVAPPIVEPP